MSERTPRPSTPPAQPAQAAESAGKPPPRPQSPPRVPGVARLVLGRDYEAASKRAEREDRGSGWLRPTIRMRLTALYGGMFLIAGVLLLGMVYLLVRQSLTSGQFQVKLPADTSFVRVNGVYLTPQEYQGWQSAQQTSQRDVALHLLLQQSLLALIALAIVAFGFGYLMAGRVLRPLGRITGIAREVAGSNLHRRIDLEGPDDELKELADTFDDMLDRLDRSFESQRKFVANASHEMRTPLAIQRTLLEVAIGDPEASADLRQLGRTLLATNERSERLIEGLLLLARSENELTERKSVDLGEVVRHAVDQTAGEAAERGVDVRTAVEKAMVAGNGVLLERIAVNLVQNAVRHNLPRDGWVEAGTSTVGDSAVLTVSNTGPNVPAYEVENLFEPFTRLRGERTGSDKGVGLGLSIVRSVVRAHGGWIEAEPRPEGGLVLRVGLPLA